MTSEELKKMAIEGGEPDASLPSPLQSLWWDAREEWEKAHETCQTDDSADCAWVHAYLHRKEGDESNAQYWYNRANKQMPEASLEEEWTAIATELLKRDGGGAET